MSVIMQMFTGIPTTAGAPGTTTDSLFNYVSLLLNSETTSSTFISDASTNNLLVSPNGSVRNDNFSPFQGDGYYSVQFNGSSYFTLPLNNNATNIGTSDITYEAWVYPQSSADATIIQGQYDTSGSTGSRSFVCRIGATQSVFFASNGNSYLVTSPAPVINQWSHVAWVKQGAVVKTYLNGIQVGSVTLPSTTVTSGNTTYPPAIGADPNGPSAYFNGYISNLRVTKSALYTANFIPPTTALTAIANTQLLTLQSNRFVDNSTNNLAITVAGTPRVSYNQPISGAGKFNSVKFNGTSDYLTVPSNAAFTLSGDFTIEGWMYPQSSGARFITIGDAGSAGGTGGLLIFRNGASGTPLVLYQNMGIVFTGSINLSDNVWYHIAVVRSGTTVTMYVNGASAGTWTSSSAPQGIVTIGAQYINGSFSVAGASQISNLRIVKGTAVYTSAFTPSTTPLTAIANTSLLTCQGNIVDASTNAFTLTAVSGPTASYLSPFNNTSITLPSTYGSGYFNGSTDYLGLPSNSAFDMGSGDFTQEGWVYMSTTASTPMLWGVAGGLNTNRTSYLYTNAGKLVFGFYYDGTTVNQLIGATTLSTNAWYHVAVVRSGAALKLYVNGVQDGSTTITGSLYYSAGTSVFQIGREAAFNGSYMTGYMSNVRIVKGTAVYTANFTPSTTPLTAITNTSLLTLQQPAPATNNGFIDNSQTNALITKTGTPTQGTFSPFSQTGWSTYLSNLGTSTTSMQFVQSGSSTSLMLGGTTSTVECWFYMTSYQGSSLPNNSSIILSFYGGSGNTRVYGVGVGNDGTLFIYKDSTGAASDTSTITGNINLNTWYHFAAVIGINGTNKFYINGVEMPFANPTLSGAWPLNFPGSAISVYAGVEPYLYATYTYLSGLNGYISNLRVVNGTAVYTGPFTPPTSPLTAISGTALLMLQGSTLKDNSSNNLSVSAGNSAAIQAVSPFAPTTSWSAATNGASVYTSSGNYIAAPNSVANFGSNNFTAECWVYFTTNSAGYQPIIANAGTADYQGWLCIVESNNTITGLISTNGTTWTNTLTSSYVPSVNNWTHIALVRTGDTAKLYANGVQIGINTALSTNAINAPSGAFYIGHYPYFPGGARQLTGYVSGVNLINGQAKYTSAFTLPTAPAAPTPLTTLLVNSANIGEYDSTGKNDLTTIGNSTLTTSQSKFGTGSMYFDGSGDWLSIPHSPLLAFGSGNFTVECWVRTPGTGNPSGVWGKKVISGYGIALANYLLVPNLTVSNNGTSWGINMSSSISLVANTWTHLAVTRVGDVFTLYVNGVVGASATLSGTVYDNNLPFVVGSVQNDGAYVYSGYIDDFRFTKGVARYTGNFTPPTAALPDNSNGDPYFNNVSLLLHGDAASSTQNVFNNNTFIDSSVGASTVTRFGTPTQGTFTPFDQNGWSGYFNNGTASNAAYLTTPVTSNGPLDISTGDFTIECWAYPTSLNTAGTIAGDWRTTNLRPWIIYATNTYTGLGINTTTLPNQAPALTLNAWQHVAVTRQGTTLTLWINGASAAVNSVTGSLNATGGTLAIGTNYEAALASVAQYGFNGQISNFRIVKGTAVYTSNFTPSTTPLTAIANTSLLTLQSNRFVDNSTNNFTITQSGTPSIQAVTPFAVNSVYSAATNSGSIYSSSINDYLFISNNITFDFSSNDFTIEAWINYSSIGTVGGAIIGRWGLSPSTNVDWILWINSSGIPAFNVNNANVALAGSTAVPANSWNHIAATRSGSTWRLFVNGVQVSTATLGGSVNYSSAQPIRTHKWNDAASGFIGYLSNVRIVNGTALYTSTFTPSTSPLTAITGTALLLNGINTGIIDATGRTDIITSGSAATQRTVVKYGTGAMSFNGSTDFVNVAGTSNNFAFGSGDYTVEMWVYPTNTTASIIYDSRGTGQGNNFYPVIAINNPAAGSIIFYYNAANQITGTGVITVNTWHHIALARSGTSTKLFVNGTQVGSTYTDTGNSIVGPDRPIIGRDGASSSGFFAGYIDDVRVTKGYARYTANFTPPNAALPTSSTGDAYFQYNSLLLSGDIQTATIPVSNNGKFIDASANSLAITATGTPTQGTFTPFDQNGWSGNFNGSTDYLTATANAAYNLTGSFTVEAWVYLTANPALNSSNSNSANILSYGSSGQTSVGFEFGLAPTGTPSPGISFGRTGAALGIVTSGSVRLNSWNHIAVTFNGTTGAIYINGVAQTLSLNSWSWAAPSSPTMFVARGVGYTGYLNYFPGHISNLRIVNGSVIYTSNFTPPTSPLTAIANTSLLTLQSNRFVDNSTNNFTITQSGTPSIQAVTPFAVTSTYSTTSNSGSIYFNGSADRLTTPTSAAYAFGTGDFTIEYWIYPTSIAAQFTITDLRGASGTVGFTDYISATNGKVNLYIEGGATFLTTTNGIPANQWTHVAYVRSGTTMKVYFNGIADPTTATNSTSWAAPNGSASFGANFVPGNWLPGYISNLRIVKGTAVYTSNFTPSTTPLTAIANTSILLSGTNDAIIDNSGSNSLITTGTAAITGTKLKYGTGSMYFDGSGAMVKGINPLMSKFGTGAFTVEAWVYPTARNTYSQIFGASVYAGNTDFLLAITTSGALYMQTGSTTTGSITTTTLVPLNTWSHIAVTRTSGYAYAYINGNLVGMVANTVDIGTLSVVPTIGSANGGTGVAGSYYTGYIDDLRVTKGIARYYGGNFTPPTQAFPTK